MPDRIALSAVSRIAEQPDTRMLRGYALYRAGGIVR
jgi:hypothetical protein